MNGRVRNINYTVDTLKIKRDTCRNKLATALSMDQELCCKCLAFIDKSKEVRHIKTLSRHINKFNILQQKHQGGICSIHNNHIQQARSLSNNHSNIIHLSHRSDNNNNNDNNNMVDITKMWAVIMSSPHLTEAQTSLLAREPKFMLVQRHQKRDYITAVEDVCLHLLSQNGSRIES